MTGGERGAVTSLSYEAKKRGLFRGMSMREIRLRCPETIVVPSNYVAYTIYAQRMYSIVRQYASHVEEYSIDECFADITETDPESYTQLALHIKEELETSLGITFGVGLAPSKTLAKIASKAHKPAGFTTIPQERIPEFLSNVPIHDVWGLGGASGTHLQKQGVITAYDFAQKDDQWLSMHHFGKAYRDTWLELNGKYIKKLGEGKRTAAKSLMCTRTFSPPSISRSFIFSQLSKNVETACAKARRSGLLAQGISFYLKTQEFTYHAVSFELVHPSADPSEILHLIGGYFDEVYAPGVLYRASGVTLRSLMPTAARMADLFSESVKEKAHINVIQAADAVNAKYGRQTIFLGSSLAAIKALAQKKNKPKSYIQLAIEQKRKTLHIPCIGVVT